MFGNSTTLRNSDAVIPLLKALLLSFWIGVNVIAALVFSSWSAEEVMQHRLMVVLMIAVLITGTTLSLFFVSAKSSSSGASNAQKKTGAIHAALAGIVGHPHHLIGAGAIVFSISLIIAATFLSLMRTEHEIAAATGRATPVIAKKCAEVASLEKKLFQSDEQFVIAQCLLQYDQQYAALRNAVK